MKHRFNLNRLSYFVATVDEGTFTAAAAQLGVSKAVVSKQVQLLELDVGTTLLLRNTRHLQPTAAGLTFYEMSKSTLIQATEAFDAVRESGRVPRGKLRVTAPVDYGITRVAPLIARYRSLYPQVELDLFLTDEKLDIIQQRYDVAFRVGWLKDSGNLVRKLQDFEEIIVCSPETLLKHSVVTPEDLAEIPFVANSSIADIPQWTFSRDKTTRLVTLNAACIMNITLAIRAAIAQGMGFTILPDFLAEDDIAADKLVRLLPEWSLRKGGVYTVTAPGRVRSNALSAFLELAKGHQAKATP